MFEKWPVRLKAFKIKPAHIGQILHSKIFWRAKIFEDPSELSFENQLNKIPHVL